MQHENVCGGCVVAFVGWLQTGQRQSNCGSCEVSLEHIGKRFVNAIAKSTPKTTETSKVASRSHKKKSSTTEVSKSDAGKEPAEPGSIPRVVRDVVKSQGKMKSTKEISVTIATADHGTTEKSICNTCQGLFSYRQLYCCRKANKSVWRTHLYCLSESQIEVIRARVDISTIDYWLENNIAQEQVEFLAGILGVPNEVETHVPSTACTSDNSSPDLTLNEENVMGSALGEHFMEAPILLPLSTDLQAAECSDNLDLRRISSVTAREAQVQITRKERANTKISYLRQTPLDKFVKKCEQTRRSSIEGLTYSSESDDLAHAGDDTDNPFASRVRQAQTPRQSTMNRCRDSQEYLESVKSSYKTMRTFDFEFSKGSSIKPPIWKVAQKSDSEIAARRASFTVQIDARKSSNQSSHDMIKKTMQNFASQSGAAHRKRTPRGTLTLGSGFIGPEPKAITHAEACALSKARSRGTLPPSTPGAIASIRTAATNQTPRGSFLVPPSTSRKASNPALSAKAKQTTIKHCRRRSSPIELNGSPVKRRSLGGDRRH